MLLTLVAAALPVLLWEQGVETADVLRRAGIECISVPAARAAVWQKEGFCHKTIDAATLASFQKVPTPRVLWKADVASATRSPWIVANGWRFARLGGQTVLYGLSRGAAALAAAEAFAYGAPAVLRIDPADLGDLGRMLAFLKQVDRPPLPPLSNIAIVDDGSAMVGEVMNLLARRNLLFRAVRAPDPSADLNVEVGSEAYPEKEASDPGAFALKIRRMLTDEKRLLRIYGSDLVLGRLTGDGKRVRLHLLNYGGRKIDGLRIRIRGAYKPPALSAAGYPGISAADYLSADGATEFTVPEMQIYSVADLEIAE